MELVDEVDQLLPKSQGRNPNAADHLRRAVESALFNAAEGIVAWRPKVKIYRYEIARRESGEARVILRRVVRQGLLTEDEARRAYNLAGDLIAMLTRAAIALEQGKGRN